MWPQIIYTWSERPWRAGVGAPREEQRGDRTCLKDKDIPRAGTGREVS